MAAPLPIMALRGLAEVFPNLNLMKWGTRAGYNLFRQSASMQQVKCYAKQSNKRTRHRRTHPNDPRYNVQYPYVRGDPLQEMQINEAANAGRVLGLNNKNNALKKQQKALGLINSNACFTTDTGLSYKKLKDGDIRLGRTILSIKSKLTVDSTKVILLEGERLIRDSLLLGAELKCLYFSDESLLGTLPAHLLKDSDLFKVNYRDLKTWMDTKTPSGILGIFRKPEEGETTCRSRERILPITLILDGIKDPGNAGTLVRTAAAIGCEKIIAVKGCVDMWEGKVVRSGMGSHFAIPVFSNLSWPHVCNYVDEKSQVFLAEPRPPDVLLHSNYGKLQRELENHEELEMNDSDSSDFSEDEDVPPKTERGGPSESLFQCVPFPSSLYCDVNLQSVNDPNCDEQHIALVVGGETTGLSAAAKKFAYDYYGQYVSLPMSDNIDSLNSAVAASVILYELRRKLMDETKRVDDRREGS